MATKKQKREAAAAKRAAFIQEEKERGLEALRLSREADERERQRVRELGERMNEKFNSILAEARANQS